MYMINACVIKVDYNRAKKHRNAYTERCTKNE